MRGAGCSLRRHGLTKGSKGTTPSGVKWSVTTARGGKLIVGDELAACRIDPHDDADRLADAVRQAFEQKGRHTESSAALAETRDRQAKP